MCRVSQAEGFVIASRPRPVQRHWVRIIGGRWRGRRVAIARGSTVRPTPDRVRETVFNWLSTAIEGARCLDLFAGTGVFGLEALSRGAAEVWFVERDLCLVRSLRACIERFDAQARVLAMNAAALLAQPVQQQFGIVFLDPPYREPLEPVLASLEAWLADRAYVYVERPRPPRMGAALAGLAEALPDSHVVRERTAAAVVFGLLRYERP